MAPSSPEQAPTTRVADLCLLSAVLAVFAHGGWANDGPTGYARLSFDAPARAGFEPLAPLLEGFGSWASLLLLAAGAALLVVLLARKFNDRWLAGVAGALYAVHPFWGEAFVWREARPVLFALPFLFASHAALHAALQRGRLPWLAIGAFLCAVLSWNGALAYGLVLALALARRRPLLAVATVLVCVGAAVVLGVFADGRPGDPSAADQLAALGNASFVALLDVVAPLGLTPEAGPDAHGAWAHGGTLLGWALMLLLSGAALLWATRRGRVALACALAVVGVLAGVHVLPAREPVFVHFRLGLCVAAFGLAFALLLQRAAFWRTPAAGLAIAVLAVVSGLRAKDLASEGALWADDAEAGRPRASLALARLAQDKTPAHAAVKRYAMLPPAYAKTGYAIRAKLTECEALFLDGDHETLLDEATEALSLLRGYEESYRLPHGVDAAYARAHRYHGDALQRVAGRRAAIEAYRRAVNANDDDVEALIRLGRALAGTGDEQDLAEATELLDRAFALSSRLDAARALARAHVLLRNPTAAFAVLDRAARRHGDVPDLLFARARAHLSGTRNVAKAEELLRRIQEIDPERTHGEAARLQAEIHVAVGRRFFERAQAREQGVKLEDALDRFDAALRASPDHWQAHVFAGDTLVALGRFDDGRARYGTARDAQPDVRWVGELRARTAVLQAGGVLKAGDLPARRKAADYMAEAVRGARRLHLGHTPLESELALLRDVAASLDDDALAPRATALLLTARAMLTGDETQALRSLAAAFAARTDDAKHPHLLDASLLLRAMLYERGGNLGEARRDYLTLAERRPDDALPMLRKLQIEMRIALAHRKTALAFPDDTERLEQAKQRVARIAERILAYVRLHDDRLDAQMVAVEADMQQGHWIESMSRLNTLRAKYPEEASVLRGLATVYMEHHAATGDPDLLTAAGRHVREALTMNPRDMRALLDQAQIAAKAQDFDKAIRFAQEAQRFDPLPRGAATRLLSELHLARARRLLEGGQADLAAKAVKDARKADPAGPGSYLWEGKVLLAQASGAAKAAKLQDALRAGLRAKELAPFGRDVDKFLADIHRQLGFAAWLEMSRLHPNPDPRKQADFKTLPQTEQKKRLDRFQMLAKRNAARRGAYRALALEHYDQALALEPVGPDAEQTRGRMATLRDNDENARRQRVLDSKAAYARGQAFQREGESLKAMRAYLEATALDPRNVRAHFWLLRTAYQNLVGVRMDDPEERRFANRTLSAALRSLHALDALDSESLFPERWYWRGQLNRWMYRKLDSAPSRHAARSAYRRFIALKAQAGVTESPRLERARTHLDALTRRGE